MKFKIPDETPLTGGEVRVFRRFAWKPTRIGNYTVWLESYEIKERYFQPASGAPGWWHEFERNALEAWY